MDIRATPHPSGLPEPCIVIKSDGEDHWGERPPPHSNPTPGALELSRIARENGLVGLGGAGFPTAVKLKPKPIGLLLVNGAECEPYISCDDMLMREKAKEIVAGAMLICRALGIPVCVVGIEDDKIESMDAMIRAVAETPRCEVRIQGVPNLYPVGGEKQLIQTVTGKEVPGGGMPDDIGILCHNVGTVLALHDAATVGRPLISRYVTVTGGGVASPRNLEVLVGTPIRHLIEHCGGYLEGAQQLILGGPMMGIAAKSDAVPVVKGTNCILVRGDKEFAPTPKPLPCIRCGDCVPVCPARLLPQQLYWHALARNFDTLENDGLFDCIECGCCATVCPSHLPLVDFYRFAKAEIRTQEKQRQTAESTRRRHQSRLQRLDRDQSERAEKMRKKRAALGRRTSAKDERKREIEAALARVKSRETDSAITTDGAEKGPTGPFEETSGTPKR
jgi:electron transport complex protein RnfC